MVEIDLSYPISAAPPHPLGPERIRVTCCASGTACGNKGATIQHPGWGDIDGAFCRFPSRDDLTPCTLGRDTIARGDTNGHYPQ
jgi:hypothetical protein